MKMKSNTLNVCEKNGVGYITFPRMQKLGCVKALFSTRLGGVSTGRYSTMNLSFNNGDSRENVLENYKRLCGTADIDVRDLVLSRQTHTDNIRVVTRSDCGTGIFKEPFNDVDGLITDCRGVALATHYADCTPLLFCDTVKRVIAAAHAGWRGTAKCIGEKTVKKMTDVFGCDPSDITAAIGPCIGRCCYEVDEPVAEKFRDIPFLKTDSVLFKKENGRYMLDLVEANRQILMHAGINECNIDASDICTCCNADELHSHRATNGERGIMAAIIELV